MRRAALVLALTVLCGGGPAAAAPPERGFDVEAYRFGIEVSDTDDVVRGSAELDISLDGVSRQIVLDLEAPRADGLGMRVWSAELVAVGREGLPLEVEQDGSQLTLTASAPVEGRVTLRIGYSGKPADGFLIGTNRHGDRTFFADHWPNRAQQWLPVVDHPSDKAFCAFDVTAPSHYQVVGCGALREETDLGDGRRRTVWASKAPMATKVMAVGIARFAVETAGVVDGVPVQSWVFPQQRAEGFRDFARAVPVLHFFSDRLGPFPYAKLANVQSKTRWGGLENASNVFYNESAVKGDLSNEGLVAHEIAHQWFGDAVSEIDWQHVWLSEGFATYLTQVYLEFTYGRDRLVEGMQRARDRVLRFTSERPDARIIDPRIEDPSEQLSAATYQKGAWVLHMLRDRIGDAAFFGALQDFYRRYRDGNARTEDFRRLVEERSGKDLTAFFEVWLRQPGHPRLRVDVEGVDAGRKQLVVRQLQERSFEGELEIETSNGDEITLHTVPLAEREVKILLPRAASGADSATEVVLDPRTVLLFERVER